MVRKPEQPKKPAKAAGKQENKKTDKGRSLHAAAGGLSRDDKKKQRTKTKSVEPEKRRKRAEPLTTAEWRKIRIEYVKGKTTYAKLAEKYNISASNIRKRAANEGWRKKKNKLDAKVEQKVLERACDARAEEFALIAQVNDRMSDVLSNLVNFVASQPPNRYDDLRGVESLTKAIAQVVQTKRDLYNVPTEIDRAKIEALRDKQKLEREKFAEEQAEKAAAKTAAENTMIRIVIEGAEEEVALDE